MRQQLFDEGIELAALGRELEARHRIVQLVGHVEEHVGTYGEERQSLFSSQHIAGRRPMPLASGFELAQLEQHDLTFAPGHPPPTELDDRGVEGKRADVRRPLVVPRQRRSLTGRQVDELEAALRGLFLKQPGDLQPTSAQRRQQILQRVTLAMLGSPDDRGPRTHGVIFACAHHAVEGDLARNFWATQYLQPLMSALVPIHLLPIPITVASLLSAAALWQLLAWRRRRLQRRLGIFALRGKLLAVEPGRPGEGVEMLALTIRRAGMQQRVLAPPSALPQGPPRLGKQLAIEAVLDETLPAGEVLYRQNARSSGVAALNVYPRWRLRGLIAPLGTALTVSALLAMLMVPSQTDPIHTSAQNVHCLPGARIFTRPLYRGGGFVHSCQLPDGRRHGDVSRHELDGRLRELQRFEHGIPHGPFRTYHPFGGGEESGEYWHGERHGTWVYRDDDGRLRGRVQFERGRRDGSFYLAGRDGSALEGHYHRGRRIGQWVGRKRLCRPLAITIPQLVPGRRRDLLRERCRYSGGLLHGPHLIELEGLTISGKFVEGKAEGRWQALAVRHDAVRGANNELRWTATFAAGQLEGRYLRYGQGAVVLEGNYADGRRVGLWRRYARLALPNSGPQRLIERWRYDRKGKLEGLYELWRSDGRPLLRGQLSGGERLGRWTLSTPTGSLHCTFRRWGRGLSYCPAFARIFRGSLTQLPQAGSEG